MIKVSFLDEVIKLGGLAGVLKLASDADPPAGMVPDHSPPPESSRRYPDDASTRLPRTYKNPSQVRPGQIGEVTPPNNPISESGTIDWYRKR